jgi:peptide/nickel transport system substrate-binding protein
LLGTPWQSSNIVKKIISTITISYRRYSAEIKRIISVVLKRFSLTEKIIFFSIFIIFIFSCLNLLYLANQKILVEVPAHGGSLSEGIIGTSRYINPVLAISDADRDMTALVYSGLLRYNADGDLIPDLAESYTISKDGTDYTFTIKPNVKFHDGTEITAEDIAFTIEKATDPVIKSPKLANWKSVKVTVLNSKQIKFSLPQPYQPFLSNLTLGILPKHLWKNLSDENFPFSIYNSEPVGSGPYKYSGLTRDSSGITSFYTFTSFSDFTGNEPYIKNIYVHFYSNEKLLNEAMKNGEIDSAGGLSSTSLDSLKNNKNYISNDIPLSHIFGFFLNQSQNQLFTQPEIRKALNESLDRDRIVDESLAGYGEKLTTPIPSELLSVNYLNSANLKSTSTEPIDFEGIKNDLTKAGWKLNDKNGLLEKKVKKTVYQFSFSISTSNSPELQTVAKIAKESWEKIGAQVDIKVFEVSELNQNIIRPRKFDTLLFGEVIGRDLDLYGYWHSSQRVGSGLNLSGYANAKVDKILEDARKIDDKNLREQKYIEFEKEISKDIPAIFSHSHEYIYVLPTKVKDFRMNIMTNPAERFLDVSSWYIETDKIWKFLNK